MNTPQPTAYLYPHYIYCPHGKMSEELVNKLADLLEKQQALMERERVESSAREERMKNLLATALAREQPQKSKIPSNATPALMLVHNASLREFNTWKQKFEDYMLLTEISKIVRGSPGGTLTIS